MLQQSLKLFLLRQKKLHFFKSAENIKNYYLYSNSEHSTRRCACHIYCSINVNFTLILTSYLIIRYSERPNTRKDIIKTPTGCLQFLNNKLCLIVNVFYSTVNNIPLHSMAMQHTGTVLVLSNIHTKSVSIE